MERPRLDQHLVDIGLAPSRARARDAILRGTVTIDGVPASKPAQGVPPGAAVALADPAGAYVSRAALKLVAALDAFGLSPEGRVALDLGASTGGFTEVLLERGAARVLALDVGHGQLHPKLATDPRVTNLEGFNARDLARLRLAEPIGFVTADVSFISLVLALPEALALAAPGSPLVALVKPQFEVGRASVGKGGVVRDAAARAGAVERIADFVAAAGFDVLGTVASPISGGDGNEETLLAAVKRA